MVKGGDKHFQDLQNTLKSLTSKMEKQNKE